VPVWPVEVVEDEWLIFRPRKLGGLDEVRHVTPPVDAYLREVSELAPTIEAVTDLSARYGRLGDHGWSDLAPAQPWQYERLWARQVSEHRGPCAAGPRGILEDDRQAVASRHDWPEWMIAHVDEITLRARIVRNLARHAVAYQRGEDVAAAWPDCAGERQAWEWFTGYLNAGLQPFRVRAWVDVGNPDFDIGVPRPSLYGAVLLQLANDLALGIAYQQCHNETCRRTFTRQRGRADFAQYRTSGVLYCDRDCARAQAAREGRRRARDKRREG